MTEKTNDAGELTNMSTSETLEQRGERYGSFEDHAQLSQSLSQTIIQHYFKVHPQPRALPPYMVESIQMVCHKLARIANGDPFYDDSWRDIAGYTELVVNILNKNVGAENATIPSRNS